ncbi:ribosome-associated translation inhibitor RaiA [bacterium]|nr:ribosome-associated translation inhibitor RaiA [bacterium]
MDVSITAKQMDLTDALKNYVTERVSRIKKYTDFNLNAKFSMGVEKHRNHIHATIKGNGFYLNSEAEDPASMYKAIDLCVDKLETQLRRGKFNYHEKKTGKESIRQKEFVQIASPTTVDEKIS